MIKFLVVFFSISNMICWAVGSQSGGEGAKTTSVQKVKPKVNDPIVISMQGKKVKLSELAEIVMMLTGNNPHNLSEEQLSKVIEAAKYMHALGLIITEKAVQHGYDRDPKNAAAFEKAKKDVMVRIYMERAIKAFSDEELKAEYLNFVKNNPVKEFDIAVIVASKEKINAIIETLKNDPDKFAAIAAQESKHRSKTNGGELGFVREDVITRMFGEQVSTILKKTVVGKITSLIALSDGTYAVFKLKNKRPAKISFDEAKQTIAMQLSSKKLYDELIKRIKAGDVKFYTLDGKLQDAESLTSKKNAAIA